jgi:diguanylate cyclase
MSKLTNPTDIARETLRLLATRRIPPNPDNYRKLYQEITGSGEADAGSEAEQALVQLAADLHQRPNGALAAAPLEKAAAEKDWQKFRGLLQDLIGNRGDNGAAGAPVWALLILDLIKQLEARHSGLTLARKRESLEKVLAIPGADAAKLAKKLQNLVKSWAATAPAAASDGEAAPLPDATGVTAKVRPPRPGQDTPAAGGAAASVPADAAVPATSRPAASAGADGSFLQLRELLAQTLEFAVVSQLRHAPDLAEEAGKLAKAARAADDATAVTSLTTVLRQFWFKLELRGGENTELHQGLLRLLQLLIDNTHDLVGDDQWLRGQVTVLKEIVGRPLDLGTIREAEQRLKEVIFKQGTLKNSLQDAKQALKQLIASFIDRLGNLSESTGEYHTRLEGYANTIRQTDDIKLLNVVLEGLIQDTRNEQVKTAATRDELIAARGQVEAAEAKVHELESSLEKISGLVHEDHLTRVLNRRGLTDAYEREVARAERSGESLCVAMLDIDDFKLLNDAHGHAVGDDALLHLVRVVKRTMRPSDVLARYGGEEFLLVLPATELEEGVAVMTRLQRDLTKAFFLHDNERLLITFSAGVALRRPGETQTEIVERADKALYQAKRAGKNRVFAA